MSGRTIAVVSGGLSQPSATRMLADRLAEATRRHVAAEDPGSVGPNAQGPNARGSDGEGSDGQALSSEGAAVEMHVIDLREHAHAVTDNLLTGFPPESLRQVIEQVTRADGLIAVTPTFAASYSGLFKMFFDILDPGALEGMPVLLAATGGSQRHSLVLEYALRPLFAYLRAAPVPTAVYAASEDWGAGGDQQHRLAERIERAGAEFAQAIRAAQPVVRRDEYADPTPFEELLAR